jgi:hypothetical protein
MVVMVGTIMVVVAIVVVTVVVTPPPAIPRTASYVTALFALRMVMVMMMVMTMGMPPRRTMLRRSGPRKAELQPACRRSRQGAVKGRDRQGHRGGSKQN